ncbi:MAG: hypothetical protein JNM18_04395 [Planctomycetaceae bacterium]|nr:hypothetical protein [Planctomycetaceae bacterium]
MLFGRRLLGQLRHWLPVWVLAILLAMPSLAAAQGKKGKNEEEAPERSYSMPYVFVVTLIALGVVVTCMPVQREPGNLDRDLA